MNTSSEPGGFEHQDDQKEEASECLVEEIDVWEPIKAGLQDFDIQSPDIQSTSDLRQAGKVELWTRIGEEKTRQRLVHQMMRLFEIWVFIGLIVFIVTRNVWLLTTAGVLGIPLKIILDYYFRCSKK